MPLFSHRLSLRRKLLLLTLLTTTVALLFSATAFVSYQVWVLRQELRHDTRTLAHLIAENSLAALASGDREALARTLSALESNGAVVAAAIYDGQGAVLARFERNGGARASRGPVEAAAPPDDRHYLSVVEAVADGERRLGTVFLKTDLYPLYEHFAELAITGAAVVLASFLVALLVAFGLQREIAAPVQQLVAKLRAYGVAGRNGDAGQGDELRLLLASFDDMLAEIRGRDAALRSSETYFRTLIEQGGDMIVLLDRDGVVDYAGPAVQRTLGYRPEAITGESIYDYLHGEDLPRVTAVVEETLSVSGATLHVECRARHADGSWRTLEATGRNLLDIPPVSHIVLNVRDISERKEVERALRESREWFRGLVEHAADGFFLHDLQGHVLDVNQRACDSLGYTRQELLGLSVPDIELNYEQEGVEETWRQMEPGRPATIQGVHRRKDGSTFPVEVRVGMLESSRGPLMVALARDMSDRERAQAELQAAKEVAESAARAKSQFLANMSHEIRTPLNAIIGMTELLEHTHLEGQQRHYLDIARSSGRTLLGLIEDVLDLSKIDSRKLVFKPRDFELRPVVEEVLDILAQQAQSKGIELAMLVQPDVPAVLHGDAGRLAQVLLNLLGNAIKFTERGEVYLRVGLQYASVDEVQVSFAVSDTGGGIPEDLRASIFEPFVQADASLRRRHGGAGLGLAIAKSLVEMMRGRLEIEESGSEGSTLRFDAWFGLRLGPAQVMPFEGERVLVVGPRCVARDLLVEQLADWGMEVVATEDAAQALERLSSEAPYGVAILDSVVDAGALKAGLEASPKGEGPAVLALRPLAEPLSEPDRECLGVAEQMAKPVKPSVLVGVLSGLLQAGERRTDPRLAGGTGDEAERPVVSAPIPGPDARRVLVAEDNPINREVALLMLSQLGYAAETVENGREALERLAQTHYDLVLMDCQMPEIDGYEATARIRRDDAAGGWHTPVVAMTAHALEESRQRCLDAGMDDYLVKPVTEASLARMLCRWLPGTPAREPVAGEMLDEGVWEDLRRTGSLGRPDFVGRMVGLFLADTPGRLLALREAWAGGDLVRVAREAHALRGGCRQIGARGMVELCGSLEQHARGGEAGAVGRDVAALEEVFEQVRGALAARDPQAPSGP